MTANSRCQEIGIAQDTIVAELELTDFDADHRLLDLQGTSLVVFTSTGCASCRWARQHLPGAALPVERLCWIDAGNNGGLVQRYEVFHLPALFVVRNGRFHGALHSSLRRDDLIQALDRALARPAEELP
ncbi:thioredoxin family protein [Pseudomonas sp. BN102]|uniref:thioredoxin family protein n=1 Tax=Pseudomonas sp. BN102 TaxID=2567886 RepID=UPI002455F06B|nr:thioredoxin family protein [Pseudomonas sp. BN102]MDH4608891.1 thioredoxin family protein [Pseudomonas sp. BN102]